jgi:hypothetical protein
MLVSLAIAAVVGALSVLIFSPRTSGDIFGTGVLTAVSCGVLLVFSWLTDKPATRAAGLLGMSLCLAEYLLGLFLIWGSALDSASTLLEQAGFAAVFLPVLGLPAVALLRIAGTNIGRWAGRVGVALCAVEFGLLMIAARFDWLFSGGTHWPATAGICAFYFTVLIMSLVGLGAAPGEWRRWLAIVASCICLVVVLGWVWRSIDNHSGGYAMLFSIPTVLAYLNLAMLCPLKSGQVWARWVAILSLTATAACIDCGIALSQNGVGDLFDRLSGALGIIAGCSTLALAIFAALNRKIERPAIALEDVHSMEIICPLCKKRQVVGTGNAGCVECGLRMSIQLEMPQCSKCGYLLYRLKSDRCPECGTGTSAVDPIISTPPPLPV